MNAAYFYPYKSKYLTEFDKFMWVVRNTSNYNIVRQKHRAHCVFCVLNSRTYAIGYRCILEEKVHKHASDITV